MSGWGPLTLAYTCMERRWTFGSPPCTALGRGGGERTTVTCQATVDPCCGPAGFTPRLLTKKSPLPPLRPQIASLSDINSCYTLANIWASLRSTAPVNFSGFAIYSSELVLGRSVHWPVLPTTFVTLTFTEEKNGVRNKTVGHGRSGHPHLCPVLVLASRVRALRASHAPADATLNSFCNPTHALFLYSLSSVHVLV